MQQQLVLDLSQISKAGGAPVVHSHLPPVLFHASVLRCWQMLAVSGSQIWAEEHIRDILHTKNGNLALFYILLGLWRVPSYSMLLWWIH